MNYENFKIKYLNKKVYILDCSGYRAGYIRDIDEAGITYEIINENRENDIYFINHATSFKFRRVN